MLEFLQFVIKLIIWNIVKHYFWQEAECVTCLVSLESVISLNILI